MLLKMLLKTFGAGVTLSNNEIKDIVKVIKSLENRGILLKGTIRKITSQEGGFLVCFFFTINDSWFTYTTS